MVNALAHLLLALLVRRRKESGDAGRGDDRSPLLRMRHPIQTLHMLPGRVRFRVPALIGRLANAGRAGDALSRIQGVREVETNARSGSVLVLFDESRLDAEILFAALIRLLDLERELKRPPVSLVRREGEEALGALNRAVFDGTRGLLDLWAVAGILAGAAALNRIVLRHLSLPGLALSAWLIAGKKPWR